MVTVPPAFYRQGLDAAAARRWATAANDGIFAAVADHPQLSTLAYLPLEHPTVALREYERARGGPHRGVTAAAGAASISLADNTLRALWRRLDTDGALVLLHPGASPDPRLSPFYLGNLLGNPMETTLAAAQLLFGDVASSFPGIRFVLVHGGGAVAALAGRWQQGVETARPGLPQLTEPPMEAVRRFFVDLVTHDTRVTDLVVAVFGEDRVVLGSDWPFPMGLADPLGALSHRGAAFARKVSVQTARLALGDSA